MRDVFPRGKDLFGRQKSLTKAARNLAEERSEDQGRPKNSLKERDVRRVAIACFG